jgi:hypothetical protein
VSLASIIAAIAFIMVVIGSGGGEEDEEGRERAKEEGVVTPRVGFGLTGGSMA